jgi:hypothetical protein
MRVPLSLIQIETDEEPLRSPGYRPPRLKRRHSDSIPGIFRDAKPYRCNHCGKTLTIWPCVLEETQKALGEI